MGRLVVATDGSSLGNPGPAGWAWIVSSESWDAGGLPRATNQVAELFAILAALRAIPSSIPLTVRTDSSYALKACSVWMSGWKANGWRRANGQPLANLKLMKELDRTISTRRASLKWEWVKGHSGNRLNEIADKKCTEASSAIRNGLIVPTGPGWTGVGKAATKVSPTVARKRIEEQRNIKEAKVQRAKKIPEPIKQKTYTQKISQERATSTAMPDRGLCLACGTPINPVTMECRCSN